LQSFRPPNGGPLNIIGRGGSSTTIAEVVVLVLETLGLLFVGLMAVAGFTVMAHRRLRSLGMLGALGATDRHIRTVMLANGAAVGAVSAVVGTLVGLVAWMAFLPTLQSISGHRIDRFALPWWAIAAAMVLTFFTAVLAAWWPARAITRISVVAALSGRPPRPQPAHRFAALGGVLLCGGIVLLAFAEQRRAGFIVGGTVATAVGLLFLAPLAIRMLASLARHTSVSVRLALRDLSRYQARSGAALGAVTLAVGIASTIAISAASAQSDSGPGNLPSNQMILYVSGGGSGGQVPTLTASEQQTLGNAVGQAAASIGAKKMVPLEQAYAPQGDAVPSPDQGQVKCPANACAGAGRSDGYPTVGLAQVTVTAHGEDVSGGANLYVATPDVLALYGIQQGQINPNADILSFQKSLGGLQIFAPVFRLGSAPGTRPDSVGTAHPVLQTFAGLPKYGSDPGALITPKAIQGLGLQAIPAGWLLQTDRSLTASQISTARQEAAAAGLSMETRQPQKSLAPLRNWSTTAGILLALGVLAMTVGLIRSETANDLRTLAATGASSNTRRNLTAVTAGALALLGGLLGTAGAYAALLAWHRSDLAPLGHTPVANLVVVLVGLPAIATAGGWFLAGREPPAVNRAPLE
jgi:putative ABC transport system permease protein